MIAIRKSGVRKDQRGVAAVEFAMLLTPLLVGILSFLDLSYQSYVRAQLQGVLNEVARAASVEHPDIDDPDDSLEDQIQSRVRTRMAGLVKSGDYTFSINSYHEFSGVGQPEALVTDVNGNGQYDSGDCWVDSNPNGTFDTDQGSDGIGGADDVVVYEVQMDIPNLTPIAGLIGGTGVFKADAKSIVRRQPYAAQAEPPVAC
ncbi:MAG TPA: TadE/TadG family type IV pilus assembly protein [Sphingomicrobium sp.]|jgi:Flp pilus assembly pilin Flp|nr:TadE/TadG family type IV pilus assembly protein [Sphingomicrobium sp.]